MGLLWFERAARRLDDDAGRRAVRVQLAVAIDDPAFGRCGAAAHVDDARFAAQLSDFLRDRTREVDLELERGEAAAGRHRRIDGTPQRRVEDRRRKAAVRDPGAVVETLVALRR